MVSFTPLFGIIVLIIAAYVAFKLIKSIVKIAVVFLLVLVGAYLLFGGMPPLSMPSLGGDSVSVPEDSRVKDIIVAAKDIAWGIEILAAEHDSDGTLLIAVANTGQFEISGIQVWVNGEEVAVTNSPPGALEKGETAILDTNYMARGQATIKVVAGQAEDEITVTV